MNYRIIPAAAEHLLQLSNIEIAAEILFPLEDLPISLRGLPTSVDDFKTAQHNQLLWLTVDDSNTPVAFIHCGVIDGHLHIAEFDVHPDHGRKGLGSQLLEHVLRIGQQRGFSSAVLTTFEHLPWNAPFYAKCGFKILSGDAIGAELAAIIKREANAGLKRRVAMGLKLR